MVAPMRKQLRPRCHVVVVPIERLQKYDPDATIEDGVLALFMYDTYGRMENGDEEFC